ncbi:MAG TPA: type VI secretion system baseplate subunit TssG [Rhizobacter sp.]|nr:type VI secretion system baseplate subunit TssG [Rhizobacter sp.]
MKADSPLLHQRRERLFQRLEAEPWAHDFFAVLREIESLAPNAPRLGSALRPGAEPIRLGQDPELDFAPAGLMSFKPAGKTPPRLGARFFGLFGPMGPLPLHITEYARDRLRNHADPTLARFADVFHHRALLLFYRAWAQSQPAVQADRPADDQFAKWVSALFGQAPAPLRQADSIPDTAKRFAAGHLARPTRNPETIVKVLRQYFQVPIRIEPYVGHWLPLRSEDRSRLGRPGARRSAPLGVSVVAGSKVWDRQYKLRLHIGPLTLAQYQQFLPGQPALTELRDWMRQLLGFDMLWDVQLVLQGSEVPALGMNRTTALGRSTWLGRKTPHPDRGELRLRPQDIRHPGARRDPELIPAQASPPVDPGVRRDDAFQGVHHG